MVQIFDDGTAISTDASGRVLAYTDTSGQVYQPNRSILADFASTVFGSVGRAIEARLAPQPAAASTTAGAGAASSSPLAMWALIAGAGFLAYRLLK